MIAFISDHLLHLFGVACSIEEYEYIILFIIIRILISPQLVQSLQLLQNNDYIEIVLYVAYKSCCR